MLDHTDTTIKLEKVYRAEHAPLHVHKSQFKFNSNSKSNSVHWTYLQDTIGMDDDTAVREKYQSADFHPDILARGGNVEFLEH